jgi:hypothetical protein
VVERRLCLDQSFAGPDGALDAAVLRGNGLGVLGPDA